MRRGNGSGTKRPGPNGARTDGGAAAAARRDTARRASLPRRTAYDVLAAVRERAAYANLLLPRLLAERQLTGRDAALATELAYGTLRGQGSYDAILAACSDRPLARLDPPVLDVLRLGAHQLLSTRVGAHAAVATSVDLAKAVAGPRVSGYVNAVLRRVATRDLDSWLAVVAPSPATDHDGYLATRYSHPRWIVAAYRAALGGRADEPALGEAAGAGRDEAGSAARASGAAGAPDAVALDTGTLDTGEPAGAAVTELEAALATGNARPRVTMAAFPSGPPREEVMPPGAEPGRWSRYAFTLESGDPAPLVSSGAAAVQDEGSQLAAIALARAPVSPARQGADGDADGGGAGELWLDMCAGPGGKARMLHGLAGPGDRLVAAELHPHRAALVGQAIERAARAAASPPGAPAAQGSGGRIPPRSSRPLTAARGQDRPAGRRHAVLAADGNRPAWPEGTFDRVLLDAPCSGLGALRRRPEARWRKSEADLEELTALQRDLLRSALRSARPGGVVAYVTCSPVPAETTDVVTEVAASVPGTEFLDAPRVLGDIPGAAAADPRFAQLWPHRHGTDAIFIALLRRAPR